MPGEGSIRTPRIHRSVSQLPRNCVGPQFVCASCMTVSPRNKLHPTEKKVEWAGSFPFEPSHHVSGHVSSIFERFLVGKWPKCRQHDWCFARLSRLFVSLFWTVITAIWQYLHVEFKIAGRVCPWPVVCLWPVDFFPYWKISTLCFVLRCTNATTPMGPSWV